MYGECTNMRFLDQVKNGGYKMNGRCKKYEVS